jgi:hypothetical protein
LGRVFKAKKGFNQQFESKYRTLLKLKLILMPSLGAIQERLFLRGRSCFRGCSQRTFSGGRGISKICKTTGEADPLSNVARRPL